MPDENGKLSMKEWGEVFDHFIKKAEAASFSKPKGLSNKIVTKLHGDSPFLLGFDKDNDLKLIINVDQISIYNSFTNLLDDLDEGLVNEFSNILVYTPQSAELFELFNNKELSAIQYSGLTVIGCPFYSDRERFACPFGDCNSYLYINGCRCSNADYVLRNFDEF